MQISNSSADSINLYAKDEVNFNSNNPNSAVRFGYRNRDESMPIEAYLFHRGLSNQTDYANIYAKNAILSENVEVAGTIRGTDSSAGVNIGNFNIISNIIRKNSSSSYLELKSGIDDSTGARLLLFSTGHPITSQTGCFELISRNINAQYALKGNPIGELYWNNASLSDISVKTRSISRNGYISFNCGLTLQWGLNLNSAGEQSEITFPIAFNNNVCALNVTPQNNANNYFLGIQLRETFSNKFFVALNKNGNTVITEASYAILNYIAIGY